MIPRSLDDVFSNDETKSYEDIVDPNDTSPRPEMANSFYMLRKGAKEKVDRLINELVSRQRMTDSS